MIWDRIRRICSQAGQTTRKISSSISPKDLKPRLNKTIYLKILKNLKTHSREKILKANSQTNRYQNLLLYSPPILRSKERRA